MKTRQVTGAVFDPFAINVAGIMRRLNISKGLVEENMGLKLHKEAKFKKMLITCCNFAESITMVGPLAQLNFDSSGAKSHLTDPSIDWVADPDVADNKDYFEAIDNVFDFSAKTRAYATADFKDVVNGFSTPEGTTKYVSVMPDLSFSASHDRKAQYSSYESTKRRTIFGENSSSLNMRDPKGGVIPCGSPYVGLMAIIFSFKRVNGCLGSVENTNLGGWPPMVFFIPSMVPSGAFIRTDGRYRTAMAVFQEQPSIAAYTIHNVPARRDAEEGIVTFGNPFRLATVEPTGKVPDTLRTLSDTLSDLWTEATIYSAVNMDADIIGKGEEYDTGKLNLEPMGLGRRIRGHNRFTGSYKFSEFEAIFRVNNAGIGTVLDEAFSEERRHTGSVRKSSLLTPQYISRASFVFPSYINNPKDFKPVMLSLQDWVISPKDSPLGGFVDPSKCKGLYKWTEALEAASKETGGITASLDVTGRNTLDQPGVHEYKNALSLGDTSLSTEESSKSLLYGVDAMLGFSLAGDPSILGLEVERYGVRNLLDSFEVGDITAEKFAADRVESTTFREGFKYAEALAGGEGAIKKVFKETKVKSGNGKRSKKISLTSDDDFVTLFDEEDVLF